MDLFDRRCLTSPPVDLRPASNPRLYSVANWVFPNRMRIRKPAGTCRQWVRTRANQRHLATQHINKLRKLINAGTAQESTYPCNAGVSYACKLAPQWIRLPHIHGPEFDQVKRNIISSQTLLFEQNRPRTIESNCQRCK